MFSWFFQVTHVTFNSINDRNMHPNPVNVSTPMKLMSNNTHLYVLYGGHYGGVNIMDSDFISK